ncbi:hypothetical protein, partial [Streptomyces ardesiacus]|uniref:hypothetical protein n=1 Tax=Streptomyces ardesiacus TaxID=285564 RepID=UPI00201F311F
PEQPHDITSSTSVAKPAFLQTIELPADLPGVFRRSRKEFESMSVEVMEDEWLYSEEQVRALLALTGLTDRPLHRPTF